MARPTDLNHRAWLLGQVRECILRRGLADSSLRSIAAEIGVSHRTLLHHFGSKEQMLVDVIAGLRRGSQKSVQARAGHENDEALSEGLDHGWHDFADLESGRFLLLFEIWVLALRQPERWPGFLDHVVADWLDLIQARLRQDGVSEELVVPAATLTVAAIRGLALDRMTGRPARAVERTGPQWTSLGTSYANSSHAMPPIDRTGRAVQPTATVSVSSDDAEARGTLGLRLLQQGNVTATGRGSLRTRVAWNILGTLRRICDSTTKVQQHAEAFHASCCGRALGTTCD